MKRRGFIGPVGDDLPTIIIIVMALTLFFAGFDYAMSAYNEKNKSLHALKAGLDISRALMKQNVIPEDSSGQVNPDYEGYKQAVLLSQSYGTSFSAVLKDGSCELIDCRAPEGRSVSVFSFLTAAKSSGGSINLKTLCVCVWE